MTLRAFVLLAVFLALFGFIGLNWTEFSSPSSLSFGFTVVHVPVSFVMLVTLVIVVVLRCPKTQQELSHRPGLMSPIMLWPQIFWRL